MPKKCAIPSQKISIICKFITNKCPHFLFGQSSGSKVINTIGETTLSYLIKCTHEILELQIKTQRYTIWQIVRG